MLYNLLISKDAENDAINAVDYYDNINSKLGDRFIKELSDTYSKIQQNPDSFSFINASSELRDIKLKSFPYVVIYIVSKTNVVVIAVLNTHRKPLNI